MLAIREVVGGGDLWVATSSSCRPSAYSADHILGWKVVGR